MVVTLRRSFSVIGSGLIIMTMFVAGCSSTDSDIRTPEALLPSDTSPPEVTDTSPSPSVILTGVISSYVLPHPYFPGENYPNVSTEGIVVDLLDSGGNIQYSTTSDIDGAFNIVDIAPGSYTLRLSHDDCVELRHLIVFESGEEEFVDYFLIPSFPDSQPYQVAEPRFRNFTIQVDVDTSSPILLKQIETDIIISANGLGLGVPHYYLYNTARDHAEGMLNPANERENLSDEEFIALTGDFDYQLGLGSPNPPIFPRRTISYLPIANPPLTPSGEPLYDFEELSSIELNHLRRVLQRYRDYDVEYPYYAVGGEFNFMAMMAGYDIDDVVGFYDDCVHLVREFFPEAEIGITINNIYEYGDYHFPPFTMKEIWHEQIDNRMLATNTDFIGRLNEIDCPYDFVSTEAHLGESDPYSMEFLEFLCEELISVGKKVYFWEFWIVSGSVENYPEHHFDWVGQYLLPPEGKSGINEEAQSNILAQFLDYIAANPDIVGFQCDAQSKDGEYTPGRMVPVPVDYGYEREDGALKPAHYTHLNWLDSLRFSRTIDISVGDSFSFEALPGYYEIRYYDINQIPHQVRFELNDETPIFHLVMSE